MDANEILVFDTSPLSHFAREGWLGPLKAIIGERQALVPDTVVDELRDGAARDSRIQAVLDAPWLEHRELLSDDEMAAFARFATLLVRKDRNRGEAGVLALASVVNGTAVIDDRVGRKAAERYGVRLQGTLALLCEAFQNGVLTVKLASACADDLLIGSYRLPFGPGGFERWASDNGLI